MDIEKKIKKLINHRMANTFANHLKSILHKNQWCGSIINNEFIVWKSGGWNGLFYPLIKGRIIENEVKLSYSLNPIGKIFFPILIFLFTIFIVLKPLEVLFARGGNAILVVVLLSIIICFALISNYLQKKALKISIAEFSDFLKK